MGAFLIVVVGWVLSLCLHEFCHAIVAYKGGDWTVREKGYLTFNPLRYTHPVYSLLLPLLFVMMGGIGLPGGAVYIDRSRLRSREWESCVALAGPASNLLLGCLISLPFLLGAVPEDLTGTLWPAVAFLAYLQFSAVVLNLIPLPPFDGFGALSPWLSPELRFRIERSGLFGLYLVFLLLWFVKPAQSFFQVGVYGFAEPFNISFDTILQGHHDFRFWESPR
jgi:Zn-dependent protease